MMSAVSRPRPAGQLGRGRSRWPAPGGRLLRTALCTLIPFPAATAPLQDLYCVLLAAGDIPDCGPDAIATARLLDAHPGLILALGDLACPRGSGDDFRKCFMPTWGRFRARMRAVPGNHEYLTADAQPYFAALGRAAGTPGRGYCSLDRCPLENPDHRRHRHRPGRP